MTEIALSTYVKQLSDTLKHKQYRLVTAESCTGGGLGFWLTSIDGSSAWYERGFITYSNAAKIDCLHVNPHTIETYGAVSKETATEMAQGALDVSPANLSIAITGVAGPLGSEQKPPGTVWIAWASNNVFSIQTELFQFTGDRESVRMQSITIAIKRLIELVGF